MLHDLMTWQWTPLTLGALAAGAWLAFKRAGRMPTFRVLLAIAACWGLAKSPLPAWLAAALHWVLAQCGPWAWIVVVALWVTFGFLALLALIGLATRHPDRIAEVGVIVAAVILFALGGAFSPAGA